MWPVVSCHAQLTLGVRFQMLCSVAFPVLPVAPAPAPVEVPDKLLRLQGDPSLAPGWRSGHGRWDFFGLQPETKLLARKKQLEEERRKNPQEWGASPSRVAGALLVTSVVSAWLSGGLSHS